MKGSLSQVPLPEVLQFISMGKPTGLLQVRQGNNEITLSIRDGKIINSSSIERRRRLGDLLVHRGLLKRSELSRLLNLQKTVESDKRLGQILVERDVVSTETIRETLRLQLEEEIWSLFSREEGEFQFDTVEPAKLGDPIVLIDIEPLILEGTRRNDEWTKIKQTLPHDGLVLAVAPLREGFERDLQLRPAEWKVLSLVNGRFTVRAIVNRSNMGRFEVSMILTQFIKSGLVVFADPPFDARTDGTELSGEHRVPSAAGQSKAAVKAVGGGLFKRVIPVKRGSEKAGAGSRQYLSPLGLIAHFTTELAERFMASRDYNAQEGDDNLLAAIWFERVQSFTRADLVEVGGNLVSTAKIERYFAMCDFSELIDEPYEDSYEGLISTMQTVYRLFAKRLGERSASRIARETLDVFGTDYEIANRGPFQLAEKVQSALRLAA